MLYWSEHADNLTLLCMYIVQRTSRLPQGLCTSCPLWDGCLLPHGRKVGRQVAAPHLCRRHSKVVFPRGLLWTSYFKLQPPPSQYFLSSPSVSVALPTIFTLSISLDHFAYCLSSLKYKPIKVFFLSALHPAVFPLAKTVPGIYQLQSIFFNGWTDVSFDPVSNNPRGRDSHIPSLGEETKDQTLSFTSPSFWCWGLPASPFLLIFYWEITCLE